MTQSQQECGTLLKQTPVEQECEAILKNFPDIPPEKKKDFCSYVSQLEWRSRHARYAFPLFYLILGGGFFLVICLRGVPLSQKSAFITGLLGCFTALLAFYKPSFQVNPAECRKRLGILLTIVQMNLINNGLKVSTGAYDNASKAVAAFLSYGLLIWVTSTKQ